MRDLHAQIDDALRIIRQQCATQPQVAIILGTGLHKPAEQIEVEASIAYDQIPHFPLSTVESHPGRLILGTMRGVPVVAMAGRFHVYEGYTMKQVTFPVRMAKALGVHSLIVSNAAGGLNPQFAAGDLMLITDHINFMGDNPLIGPNDETLGPRFPDMSEPYTQTYIEMAERLALEMGVRLQRGVYLACPGPSLETRAEYRMMRFLGADAVGMSTVPEVIAAVHAGLAVLGFSVITDECLPDALEPVDIAKIIATAEASEPTLTRLVLACIEEIGNTSH